MTPLRAAWLGSATVLVTLLAMVVLTAWWPAPIALTGLALMSWGDANLIDERENERPHSGWFR